MLRLTISFLFVTFMALGQQDHRAMVNEHGDHEMGFSHEKTTHHFELNYEGGVIDVRANDVKDTDSRDQIKSHFEHIAKMFAAGNFNVPMLVHSTTVPGTATMSHLKDQLHWTLSETARGSRLTVVADNQTAREAVYEFLRFQIKDHETGDCPMVR